MAIKINDPENASVANSVLDVLEGKVKKEEVKYPHMMYDPKTGKGVEAKNEKEHNELSKKGYTHEKPKIKEYEEPRAKGEKDFKDKHVVKKSGMKDDGTNMKEAKVEEEETPEETEKQKKYQAFFNKALKKFGVKSPSELDKEKKKEFFDYIDANYEGENESD